MTEDQNKHIERALTDVRIEVASGFAAINARLDASKDHEPRLRLLEQNQLTRADVADMLKQAIEASRRPAWRDVGALIAAISTASGLVLVIAKAASVV